MARRYEKSPCGFGECEVTSDEIAKAREIIAQATPGPWEAVTVARSGKICVYGPACNNDQLAINDADFIAAARTGWPRALDEIERLAAELQGVLSVGAKGMLDQLEKLRAAEDKIERLRGFLDKKGIECPVCNAEIYFVKDNHLEIYKEKAAANKEINILRAALEFYADEKTWNYTLLDFPGYQNDKGARAREALGK